MRLLCWNVLNDNPDTARIDRCLKATNPDIVILQEALPAHLDQLRTHFPALIQARDYIQRGQLCYLTIAARAPFSSPKVVAHFDADKPHPSRFSRRAGWVEFLDTMSVDLALPGSSRLKIVTLHTSAATGPTDRLAEMHAAATEHVPEEGACIVAGDFNMFSQPWLAPVMAWPFGYNAADWCIREPQEVSKYWRARGFRPGVRGVTLPRWRMQLDQVFLRGIAARSARIIPDCYGSDHRPILLDLDV